MDMLTKLKKLSNQLDDPIFASEFSKGFEEFLEKKHIYEFDKVELLEVVYSIEDDSSNDKDVKNKSGLLNAKPFGFYDVLISIETVMAA